MTWNSPTEPADRWLAPPSSQSMPRQSAPSCSSRGPVRQQAVRQGVKVDRGEEDAGAAEGKAQHRSTVEHPGDGWLRRHPETSSLRAVAAGARTRGGCLDSRAGKAMVRPRPPGGCSGTCRRLARSRGADPDRHRRIPDCGGYADSEQAIRNLVHSACKRPANQQGPGHLIDLPAPFMRPAGVQPVRSLISCLVIRTGRPGGARYRSSAMPPLLSRRR
jgi:hypothetical protein